MAHLFIKDAKNMGTDALHILGRLMPLKRGNQNEYKECKSRGVFFYV